MKRRTFNQVLCIFSGFFILSIFSCEDDTPPYYQVDESIYVKVIEFHTGNPIPDAKVVVKGYWGGGFGTAPYEARIDSFYTDSSGYCTFLRKKYIELMASTYTSIGVCCNVPNMPYKESCSSLGVTGLPGIEVTLQPTGWLCLYINDVLPLHPEFTSISLSVKAFATHWPYLIFRIIMIRKSVLLCRWMDINYQKGRQHF
jgi:hypothetical protein